MATIDYKQLATPEANLIELLAAQNQDGTYTAKLMGSEPFAVLAAKTIYNAYNDIEDNMAADVEGPASSTDNAVARFNGTTGKLLQNSLVTIDDSGGVVVPESLNITNIGLATGIFFASSSQQRGQIIYTGGAIRFLSGVTTNGLIVGSSTSQLQFNNSGLATLTGNLTVSGTGTSAFSGQISSTSAATASGDLRLNHSAGGKVIRWASANYNVDLYQSGDNDILRTRVANFAISSDPAFASNFTTIAAGNITTTGNLTVNGSSFLIGGGSGSQSAPNIAWTFSSQTGIFFPGGTVIGFTQGASETARFSGGKFLLGTTTDSGNGRIQLATHTTSAGGIGFGTDISLYRDTNSTLNGTAPGGYALNRTGMNGVGLATGVNVASDAKTANDAIGISLSLQNSSSAAKTYGQIYAEINSATASSENGSLVLRTIKAGTLTTALTLDSSQNATFAGAVKAPSYQLSTDAQGTIISSNSNVLNIDAAAGDIRVRPKAGSDFVIGNSAAIKLGNAYTAGAPTATGYVTIKDSAGNTYKVLVGT